MISIDGRVKRLYSIWLKLKAPEDRPRAGLRLRRAAHRHAVGEGLLRRARHHPPEWSPVPGRIKDFIAMPRPNGYQSLHTSVIGERGFPVRGPDPHRGNAPASPKRALRRTGSTRKAASAPAATSRLPVAAAAARMAAGSARPAGVPAEPEDRSLSRRGLHVHAARHGKVLPKGSTAIDFAYAIHTDVGHQCVGARVNGRMVPLRTRLKNGDIVEIVTQPAHKPSRDWLNFA